MQSIEPDIAATFLKRRPRSAFIQLRINRRTLVAAVVSLLLHLLGLYIFSIWPKPKPTVESNNKPLEVSIAPPAPQQPRTVLPPVIVKPSLPKLVPKPAPQVKPPAQPTPAPAITPPTPIQQPAPPKPTTPAPVPTPAVPIPAPTTSQPTDLASYLRAKRAQRGEVDDSAAIPDDQRSASNSLPPAGVNGIFQINSMDNRYATFTFRGWKNELSYTHRETYQIVAPIGGDIRLETIRKMIEIIRRYYTGDFNWNSYRLQRVVVLSARPEDNAGLENFMMKEFFGEDAAP